MVAAPIGLTMRPDRHVYKTIVADPPWPQPDGNPEKSRDGRPRGEGLPYAAMTLEDIKALPVHHLADPEGCRLFLWITNHFLRYAWDVAEAWGFTPMDRVLVWAKPPRCTTPVTTEFILIAKRGKPPPMPWHGSTWFDWPLQSDHSAKPTEALDLIESWSPGPYLELFARRQLVTTLSP